MTSETKIFRFPKAEYAGKNGFLSQLTDPAHITDENLDDALERQRRFEFFLEHQKRDVPEWVSLQFITSCCRYIFSFFPVLKLWKPRLIERMTMHHSRNKSTIYRPLMMETFSDYMISTWMNMQNRSRGNMRPEIILLNSPRFMKQKE